jgi:hypothetical protein
MSKKVTSTDLEKLIKEALLSEVDMDVFKSMIGSNFPASEFQRGEETGLTDVNFQTIQDFAKAAPDEGELDEKDIQHFMDNPDLIDTKVQSVLIAIKRLGDESWLENQVTRTEANVEKYEQIIQAAESNPGYIEYQNKEETFKAASEQLKSYQKTGTDFFKSTRTPGHQENRQLIVKVLKDLSAEKFDITPRGIINLQQAKGDGETSMTPDTDFVYKIVKDPSTKKQKNVGLEELLKAKKLRDETIILRDELTALARVEGYRKSKTTVDKTRGYLRTARTSMKLAKKRYNDFISSRNSLEDLSKKASEALDRLDDLIAQAAQKDQSISDPIMKTAGGDAGKFTPDQEAVVKRLLFDEKDIVGRMKKINTISERYFEAATTNSNPLLNKPISEVLSEIMLLDLFNTMSKEFDSGAGAYLFENFLALIMSGKVAGKEKTTKGRMGAVDFVTKAGEQGSAKYYQNVEGVSQALGGFEDLYKHVYNYTPGQTDSSGEPMIVKVRYVIAAKKQDVDQIGSPKRGTSDPSKIIGAEIFTPLVEFGIKLVNGVEQPFAKIEGGNDIKIKEGKLLIGPVLTAADSIGMLYITTARTRTFKEMVEDAMAKQEDDTKKAFEAFEQYFDELRSASTNSKTYIASGNINDGNTAIDNLENCEDLFKTIIELMEYNDELDSDGRMVGNDTGLSYGIDEQKITADFLKKLISESFKK